MKKSIKMSLIVIFILIAVCAVIVIWHPWKGHSTVAQNSSSAPISSQQAESSQPAESSLASRPESSSMPESSIAQESSEVSELLSGLVPEDQPDSPNLNFETSGSAYDDILVNVLTCLISRDMTSLSAYVGSQGLRLSPTGSAVSDDVILSADQVADFFSLGEKTYGTFPGSGEPIVYSPEEYYNRYMNPAGFDFAASTISYNDAADLSAVNGTASDPKTVAYDYSPSVMEWMRLILVFDSDGNGDVLSGIIYQDVTTD